MNSIASECKAQKHHPEWSNVYNTTFIRWTSHSPSGLSEKDVVMASFCDEKAVEFSELRVEEQHDAGLRERVRGLADRVAREGGASCVPAGRGGRGKVDAGGC